MKSRHQRVFSVIEDSIIKITGIDRFSLSLRYATKTGSLQECLMLSSMLRQLVLGDNLCSWIYQLYQM